MENINERLGEIDPWIGRTCVDCGRGPMESRLNIEGVIHHGCKLRCIDRKSCELLKRDLLKRYHEEQTDTAP